MAMRNELKIVEFFRGNPVNRAFVEEACLAYANTIVKKQAKVRKCMEHSHAAPDDWIQSAKDYLAEVVPPHRR
jgi:hypothetical protein